MIKKICICVNTECEQFEKINHIWIPDLADILDQKCKSCNKIFKCIAEGEINEDIQRIIRKEDNIKGTIFSTK